MKILNQALIVALVLSVGLSQSVFSQDSDGAVITKKVEEKKVKVEKQVDKKVEKTKNDAADENQKLREGYAEKLKQASTEEEKKEIKESYKKEMQEASKAKNNANAKVNDAMKDADASAEGAAKASKSVVNDGPGKKKGNLSTDSDTKKTGANRGNPDVIVSLGKAKATVEKTETMLIDHDRALSQGEARIAAARERLAKAQAEGKLTEAEVAAKQAKINDAEAQLNKVKAILTNAKNKVEAQKTTLSGFNNNG